MFVNLVSIFCLICTLAVLKKSSKKENPEIEKKIVDMFKHQRNRRKKAAKQKKKAEMENSLTVTCDLVFVG